MAKFKTIKEYEFGKNNIHLNVYSLSDDHDTLLDCIMSLINNVKRESFNYELSYACVKYVTKYNVKILCMNPIILDPMIKKKLIVSLTNDIALLIECLFYVAISYRDVDSIEYLINTYANTENIKNLTCICTECHVEPLKYIILNNYNNLPLSTALLEIIKNEIFYIKYERDREDLNKEYKYSYDNYLRLIQNFGLPNIVNHRLLVKGLKEYNYNNTHTCNIINNKYQRRIQNNYTLYCEITSYDAQAPVHNVKYVSITFHRSYYDLSTTASMNCEILEQLPPQYDLNPIRPIYFSITAGTFDEMDNEIENEVFIFSDIGSDEWYPEGFYKIRLELFTNQCETSNKRTIEGSNLLLRNITYETPQTMQDYLETRLKRYKRL